jgi:hypothetical protein
MGPAATGLGASAAAGVLREVLLPLKLLLLLVYVHRENHTGRLAHPARELRRSILFELGRRGRARRDWRLYHPDHRLHLRLLSSILLYHQ